MSLNPGCIFFTFISCKFCLVCLKKNKQKRGRVWHIFKKYKRRYNEILFQELRKIIEHFYETRILKIIFDQMVKLNVVGITSKARFA